MPDHLARRNVAVSNGHRAKSPSPYVTREVYPEPPVIEAEVVHRVEVVHYYDSGDTRRAYLYGAIGWVICVIVLIIFVLIGG